MIILDVNVFNCILNTVFLHAKRFANGLFEILQVGAKQEKHKTENAKSGTSGTQTLSLAGDRTSAASSTLDSKLYRSDFV